MDTSKKARITELHWKDLRVEFAKGNAELSHIIDELDPGTEYTLFKVNYPFGSEILKRSLLFIPNNNGKLVPLNSDEIPKHVQSKLNYNINSNPVSVTLKNTAEVFIVIENHTIPLYGLISPGRMFGTWRVLNPRQTQHPIFIWDMTAGVRSVFMLPKISETAGYHKLRRAFQLQTDKPKQLRDHWEIFREIANHPEFGEDWEMEIVFFPRQWFERLNDKKWLPFKNYLLEMAWENSEFYRNQFIWDLAFSVIQKELNIKPSPYNADTAKHLLAIGIGAMPGFAPALDDKAGPIHRLQEIFSNVYQLNDYAPVIMLPHFFSLEERRPVYYSLQYPTTIEFSPKSRENTTKIFNLYEIKLILNNYLSYIRSNKLNVSGTLLYDVSNKVQYDFFHSDIENYRGIRSSEEIPKEDTTFKQVPKGMNKNFPSRSTFVRGCIRVTAKTQ